MAWTINHGGAGGPPIDLSILARNEAMKRQLGAQPSPTLSALGSGLGQGMTAGIQDLFAQKREQRYLNRLDKRDAAALARERARNEAIAQRRLEEQQRAQLYEQQQVMTKQSEEWLFDSAERLSPIDANRFQDAQNELAAVWNDPKTTVGEKLQAREQYSADVIEIGAKYKPQSREQQAQQMIVPLPQLGEGVMGQITYRNNKPQIDVLEETTPAYKAKVQADMLQARPPFGPQGASTMPIAQSPYAHLAEYYPPGTEVFVNPKTQEPKFIQPPKSEKPDKPDTPLDLDAKIIESASDDARTQANSMFPEDPYEGFRISGYTVETDSNGRERSVPIPMTPAKYQQITQGLTKKFIEERAFPAATQLRDTTLTMAQVDAPPFDKGQEFEYDPNEFARMINEFDSKVRAESASDGIPEELVIRQKVSNIATQPGYANDQDAQLKVLALIRVAEAYESYRKAIQDARSSRTTQTTP
jgi:hypothetical protein